MSSPISGTSSAAMMSLLQSVYSSTPATAGSSASPAVTAGASPSTSAVSATDQVKALQSQGGMKQFLAASYGAEVLSLQSGTTSGSDSMDTLMTLESSVSSQALAAYKSQLANTTTTSATDSSTAAAAPASTTPAVTAS
jgi:hypothetical protein